jgi:small multidrug resistance pump
MAMHYLYLLLAIVFEAGWAIAMKLSVGLSRPWPTAATVVMYILSLIFLALATKKMEIGTAYAVWAGAGVSIIAVAGIVWFGEPVSAPKVASLLLILAGIVGLQIWGTPHAPAP